MRVLYQPEERMSRGNYKIFVVATVHGKLFSSLKRGEGNRRGVIPDNGELFHACIVHEFPPRVKPLACVF
tara:strand:- start:267 stop:476 length:210 start_codon:yes stop_codon:yes gene_type:complete